MRPRRSGRPLLTRGDKILIAALLLVSLASLFFIDRLIPRGSVAVVAVDGQERLRLTLSQDGRREVAGPLGETIVEVRDGRARVVESPCPHRICVRTGWAARSGDMIVCVPNRVVVRVEGAREGDVDATTW
jgi:hypothetical protein